MNRPLKRDIVVYQNFIPSDSLPSNQEGINEHAPASSPEKTFASGHMNRTIKNSDVSCVPNIPHARACYEEAIRPIRNQDAITRQFSNDLTYKRCDATRKKTYDSNDQKWSNEKEDFYNHYGKNYHTESLFKPKTKITLKKKDVPNNLKSNGLPYDVTDATNVKVFRSELNCCRRSGDKSCEKQHPRLMYCMCKRRSKCLPCPYIYTVRTGTAPTSKRMGCCDTHTRTLHCRDKGTVTCEDAVNETIQTEKPEAEDKEVCAVLSDQDSVMYMEQVEGSNIKKWKCKRLKSESDLFQEVCCCNEHVEGRVLQCCCRRNVEAHDCAKRPSSKPKTTERKVNLTSSASTLLCETTSSNEQRRKKSPRKLVPKKERQERTTSPSSTDDFGNSGSNRLFVKKSKYKDDRCSVGRKGKGGGGGGRRRSFPKAVFSRDTEPLKQSRKSRLSQDCSRFPQNYHVVRLEELRPPDQVGKSKVNLQERKVHRDCTYSGTKDEKVRPGIFRVATQNKPFPQCNFSKKFRISKPQNNPQQVQPNSQAQNLQEEGKSKLIIKDLLRKQRLQLKPKNSGKRKNKEKNKESTLSSTVLKKHPEQKRGFSEDISENSMGKSLILSDMQLKTQGSMYCITKKRDCSKQYGIKKVKLHNSNKNVYVLLKRKN